MRETVQGVKRVGPRRSNGEGSLIVVGGGVEGAGTAVRWAGSRRLFAAAVLVSFSLVGLCDRLGGGHTVWVSWGIGGFAVAGFSRPASRPSARP